MRFLFFSCLRISPAARPLPPRPVLFLTEYTFSSAHTSPFPLFSGEKYIFRAWTVKLHTLQRQKQRSSHVLCIFSC